MIRLDECALRDDDAYRAAYALAMAHHEHLEALYRGLFDAIVDTLARYFTRAKEPHGVVNAPPRSHRSHRSQRPFLG